MLFYTQMKHCTWNNLFKSTGKSNSSPAHMTSTPKYFTYIHRTKCWYPHPSKTYFEALGISQYCLRSRLGVKVSTALISGQKTTQLYFIDIWKKTIENPAGLSIKIWCNYMTPPMTIYSSWEHLVLPAVLHITLLLGPSCVKQNME